MFGWCARRGGGAVAALAAGAGRVVHGAGAALAGVAGLAFAASLTNIHRNAVGVLLGAVALGKGLEKQNHACNSDNNICKLLHLFTGVLVGYPFGGSAYFLWSPAAPFQIICFALLLNLGMSN